VENHGYGENGKKELLDDVSREISNWLGPLAGRYYGYEETWTGGCWYSCGALGQSNPQEAQK